MLRKYTTLLLYSLHYTNDPIKALKTQLNKLRLHDDPAEFLPNRNYATELRFTLQLEFEEYEYIVGMSRFCLEFRYTGVEIGRGVAENFD